MSLSQLKKLWLSLLCFYFAQTSSALAQELELPTAVQGVYQPFSGLQLIESFTVRVSDINDEEGQGDVDPERDAESTQSADTIVYGLRIRPSEGGTFQLTSAENLYLPFILSAADSQPLRLVDEVYLQELRLSNNDSDSLSLAYDIVIAESIWAAPGTYSLLVDVELVDMLDLQTVLFSRTLEFSVSVFPRLQTNLAGQLGSFEDGVDVAIIDFGTLETGENKKIFIQVRGNAKALISLTSENQGKMVHNINSDWQVDYSVDVDGETSDLESPMRLERVVAKNFQGSAYPMTVTVGDVSSSFSGKYRDVITVDVSPQ